MANNAEKLASGRAIGAGSLKRAVREKQQTSVDEI